MEREAIPGVTVSLGELVRLRAAARGLTLDARNSPASPQSGIHRSGYRGRGLEFDEVRVYQPGDDVRTIDWRVTARRGKPHTKIFREERERPVLFLVDLAPGMFFGTRVQFKSVLASRCAAILAWTAAQSGDRAGGVVLGPDDMRTIMPRPRQAGVLSLLHAIVELQPYVPGEVEPGRLDQALSAMNSMTHSGSLVVLISDFRELGERGEALMRAIALRNDVLALLVHDALEKTPPPPGIYRFGTRSQQVDVDTSSEKVRKVWSREFMRHRDALYEATQGLAVRWIDLPADVQAGTLMKRLFYARRRAAA